MGPGFDPVGVSTRPKRVLIIGAESFISRVISFHFHDTRRFPRLSSPPDPPCDKPMAEQVILAISTCPDEGVARRIAEALVSEKLATCVNRIAGMRSSYIWDGILQDDGEVLLIIKSTAGQMSQLERRLNELHPYELPEFVVTPVTGGNERYLDWIRRNVRSEDDNQ
jgi:periplasmic divalent cation tolerance protein